MGLVFVDVEATGISPYSGVMTEFGAVEYKTGEEYHGVLWNSMPDPDNPAKSVLGCNNRGEAAQNAHELRVMEDFEAWLKRSSGRPIFVSDNPAYDFQWISYYFDKALRRNPFGHSGRRIADFYAGLMGDFSQTQKWKQWRVTPHDHNPVHDARGNVEAFRRILKMSHMEKP